MRRQQRVLWNQRSSRQYSLCPWLCLQNAQQKRSELLLCYAGLARFCQLAGTLNRGLNWLKPLKPVRQQKQVFASLKSNQSINSRSFLYDVTFIDIWNNIRRSTPKNWITKLQNSKSYKVTPMKIRGDHFCRKRIIWMSWGVDVAGTHLTYSATLSLWRDFNGKLITVTFQSLKLLTINSIINRYFTQLLIIKNWIGGDLRIWGRGRAGWLLARQRKRLQWKPCWERPA